MTFGWRGGTAPESTRGLALPMAPVFRGHRGKSTGRTPTKRGHGHQQPRGGLEKRDADGKRHSSGNGMGPMLSSRPASRQALSDLMDLNLALKFDKMGKQGDAMQPKKRTQFYAESATRGDNRDDAGRGAADPPSAAKRFSVPLDRYPSPSDRFAHGAYSQHSSTLEAKKQNHSRDDTAVSTGLKQSAADKHDWDDCLRSATPYVASTDAPLMISPSGYFKATRRKESPRKGSCEGRGSPVSTFAEKYEPAYRARGSPGCAAWKSQDYGALGPSDDEEVRIWAKYTEERQGNHSPCQETSSQQSEKDQRTWSVLKDSLLSGREGETDPSFFSFGEARTYYGRSPASGSDYVVDPGASDGSKARKRSFFQGARDMEQLDFERSAMDRTMRLHRVASVRLLDTAQVSPVRVKVKQRRNFSASATRTRNRLQQSTNSIWTRAGSTLQCTGVRAELVSRNDPGYSSEPFDDEGVEGFSRRESGHQLTRKAELGRFQWVTNDEGVANFLQRPPSRQKEAFPTHLADVAPYAAFQVEIPMADEKAKQHIEATRKNAVEQPRPPSRHKPPGQSLFLEVPETRRHAPSAFCSSRAAGKNGAESCGALPPGIPSLDAPDAKASSASRNALEAIFALDRRHDNPDRDGFSVLQVQGPCPFRIEVTNSETGMSSSSKWSCSNFVQPQPPAAPFDRESVARQAEGRCPPDPVTHNAGGRTSARKQRAPINTTPDSAASSPISARGDTAGKTCAMSFRLLGSRSTGGIAWRGGSTPEGIAAGDISLTCPLTGNRPIGIKLEGVSDKLESGELRGPREVAEKKCICGRANAAEGGSHPSPRRGDISGLLVNTGTPILNVSDWSLQSCDDVDDCAFFDGPASTLDEAGGTKHSLLQTTLGQDFLSLFAPSPDRDSASISREKR